MRRRGKVGLRIKMGRRILGLCAGVLLIWAGLVGRLYQLHIADGPTYARMAFHQRTLSLPIGSGRGMILDRRGVPLSAPRSHWDVAIFPDLVKSHAKGPDDKERTLAATARALGSVLGLWEDVVYQQLLAKTSPFWLGTDLSGSQAEQVSAMGLPGVAVGPVTERYGKEALAHHLVGYVNQSGGQLGIERLYDEELQGDRKPELVAYLDGRGNPLSGLGVRTILPATGKEPYDLHTTIDSRIQLAVEQVLDLQRHPAGGEWRGAVVVMEPRAGEVLAMASRPLVQYADLDKALKEGDGSFLHNRAVTAYAPGSVFKAVVAAAALEAHVVDLDEQFYCPGHYEVGDTTFHDAEKGGHGWITFREAIARSCNITFLKVGLERLGIQRLEEAAARYGFGAPTGIWGAGKPEDDPGHLPETLEDGAAQMAFGQGLTVTPVQIARAFSAIANGGTLPPVKLITEVKSPTGEVIRRPAAGESKAVMSRQTNRELQKGLLEVTSPDGKGTGRSAWIPQVGSAGKTGSAEGTDLHGNKTVHGWFAGYFPAAAPRYVVVVMVEGGQAGGTYAAPIFREIGEAILATAGY